MSSKGIETKNQKGKETASNIQIHGARVNNLKNINVTIPRNSLTVITGLSGSGKSSLAFNTIYAEGQRRYIETFSAYARNFLGGLQRPEVDQITGLSPVISIEQKTTNKNPRSTVGTITEVYDYLRLLYARASTAFSYITGEKMVKYTEQHILNLILEKYDSKKIYVLAPLVRSRKGHYRELFDSIIRKGFLNVRVDGELKEVVQDMKLDRYKNHDIEVVIDRMCVSQKDEDRLKKSIGTAMQMGKGVMMIIDVESGEVKHYSRRLMCPTTGISYQDPSPNNFSFNSPQGACPCCNGLGYISSIDEDKIIPDRSLSVKEGGLAPLGKFRSTMIFWQIAALLDMYGYDLDTPLCDITPDVIHQVIYGCQERICIKASLVNQNNDFYTSYEGIGRYINQLREAEQNNNIDKWAESFDSMIECPECKGARLNKEALCFKIGDKNISQLASMDIVELQKWLKCITSKLDKTERAIAEEIIKEISTRVGFLLDVGLDYLSLNRATMTLSGGESQRIRLATQIGAKLVNVLYILDEPSIGLHQRDNERLIKSLKSLRDMGNTVIVVEHDSDMMLNADYIVDMGPNAGKNGGEVMFQGVPDKLIKADTITGHYLSNKLEKTDYLGSNNSSFNDNQHFLFLHGCCGNNLKNIDVSFPLGKLICVTGVSGSGKSTLINDTLQPILSQLYYHSLKEPLKYSSIEGAEYLNKVVTVDQSPIGRTPRSNPATYTGVFSDIRDLFATIPEAKIRGYKPGRFSFNVKGGRCETCSGNGYKTIEMNFLPNVYVPCETCHGKRYSRETLEVRFKGHSISDVLDMTINQAIECFENQPNILSKIKVLQDVGLGYIKLGQSSTTLSGGESQRVKLATELAKKDTGSTLYILDEPTTGLHYEDIKALMIVLRSLVEKGNTVIVIEHNTDVIHQADYIIDMGPEGGRNGGEVVAQGSLADIINARKGFTWKYL